MKQRDCEITFIRLLAAGYSIQSIRSIVDMDKKPDAEYYEFIKAVMGNPENVANFARDFLVCSAGKLSVYDPDSLPF